MSILVAEPKKNWWIKVKNPRSKDKKVKAFELSSVELFLRQREVQKEVIFFLDIWYISYDLLSQCNVARKLNLSKSCMHASTALLLLQQQHCTQHCTVLQKVLLISPAALTLVSCFDLFPITRYVY